MISHLDHVVYPLAERRFAAVVDQFRRAGFIAHTRQVQHDDGRVSAFFRLSGGYLEFSTHPRCEPDVLPSGSVWLCCIDLDADIQRLQASARARVVVSEKAPLGEHEPAWLLANLPSLEVERARVSIIEYLRGVGAEPDMQVGRNGVFAIEGVTLRCYRPKLSLLLYQRYFQALWPGGARHPARLPVGEQWLTFVDRAAALASAHIDSKRLSLLVHLATLDLGYARGMLEAADFMVDDVPALGMFAQSRIEPSIGLVLEHQATVRRVQARLAAFPRAKGRTARGCKR